MHMAPVRECQTRFQVSLEINVHTRHLWAHMKHVISGVERWIHGTKNDLITLAICGPGEPAPVTSPFRKPRTSSSSVVSRCQVFDLLAIMGRGCFIVMCLAANG